MISFYMMNRTVFQWLRRNPLTKLLICDPHSFSDITFQTFIALSLLVRYIPNLRHSVPLSLLLSFEWAYDKGRIVLQFQFIAIETFRIEQLRASIRPGFISSSMPNNRYFQDPGYYPEARNCVFTRPIRSSQTSSDGLIFWKRDQDYKVYFHDQISR